MSHREGRLKVVEDRNDDRHYLSLSDGRQQGEVHEEGGEGGDGGGSRQAHALRGMDTHGLADPLGDGVGEFEILDELSFRAGVIMNR